VDYDLGDPVERTLTVQVDGVATDPTAVTFTLRSPSGVVTTPTPAKTAVGSYRVLLQPAEPGTWRFRWETTGAGQGAETGSFDVLPWTARLLDLAELREQLRASAADGRLLRAMRVAEEYVASEVGTLDVPAVPALWREMAFIVAEHLYDSARTAPSLPLQAGEDEESAVVFGRGFAIPRAARELAEVWKRTVASAAPGTSSGAPRFAFPAPVVYPAPEPTWWSALR
jgi:hypothetical protein